METKCTKNITNNSLTVKVLDITFLKFFMHMFIFSINRKIKNSNANTVLLYKTGNLKAKIIQNRTVTIKIFTIPCLVYFLVLHIYLY